MSITKNKKIKGFSLIELLVSIAIFSIALVMILGATMSILDANKKARTLMTVMNNLNFAVDSMTRSFSTGNSPSTNVGGCAKSFYTKEIDYGQTNSALTKVERDVYYCFVEVNGWGKIVKVFGGHTYDLTSPDLDIDFVNFTLENRANKQPKLLINIEGTAKIGSKMSSTFAIQTTVTQKKLKF
jgi:prepilin-type N-terminal cleavage/methylation domain-containing protein